MKTKKSSIFHYELYKLKLKIRHVENGISSCAVIEEPEEQLKHLMFKVFDRL